MKFLDVPQSGSVAGTTSSRNRFGQYKRTRAVPVNPNSDRQSLVRTTLASLAAGWAALTEAQRTGWNVLAAGMGVTDSLGSVVFPTGFNRFVGTNLARINMELAQLNDAPTPSIAPAAPEFDLLVTPTTAVVEMTGVTAGERYTTSAAPYGRPGREYFSDFRFLQTDLATAGPVSLDIFNTLQAKFGDPVVDFVLAVRVNRHDNDGLLISQTVLRKVVEP